MNKETRLLNVIDSLETALQASRERLEEIRAKGDGPILERWLSHYAGSDPASNVSARSERDWWVCTPLESIKQAAGWLETVSRLDLTWHLEEDPASIHYRDGLRVFTDGECDELVKRQRELYGFNWGDFECPIGYLLYHEGQKGSGVRQIKKQNP